MMSTPRMQYATDVTDAQWQRIEPLLPVPRWRLDGPGRPPRDRRQIVNGLLYLNKTGCPWALLPCCFGPWKTVYDYFRRWSLQGVWPQGWIDSQSGNVAYTDAWPPRRLASLIVRRSRPQRRAKQPGMTRAKRSKDVNGICWWIPRACLASGGHRRRCRRPRGLEADADPLGCYWRSPVTQTVGRWRLSRRGHRTWVADSPDDKIDLEVVAKQGPGFTLLKRRWVVERTFAWLMNFRRHARDYEVDIARR